MEATQTIAKIGVNRENPRLPNGSAAAATLVPGYREIRTSRSLKLILENKVEDLWPYLCDTDRIEKEAGFDPARYTYREDETGRLLHGEASLPGTKMKFTEMPFEWEYLKYHSLERVFHSGPFKYFNGRFDLERLEDGRTGLTITFHYVPRYRLLPSRFLVGRFIAAIRGAVLRMDANLSEESKPSPGSFEQAGLGAANPADDALKERIRELAEKWSSLSPDTKIPSALSEFIFTRPDTVVGRLRPFEVAEYLSVPPMEVLTFCLRAVKAGHLELSWDILCPSCRGTADQGGSLDMVNTRTHCEACNIDYTVEFDKHVELTFRPAPAVRALDPASFCPAAPSKTRHVVTQIHVLPGEVRELRLREHVESINHEVRIVGHDMNDALEIELENGNESTEIELDLDGPISGAGLTSIGADSRLRLRNSGSRVRVLKLESTRRDTRIATADLVTSLQEFRSLFSSEVLRPGVQLGVAGITVLFSDLKDSTIMYETRGDAPAFAVVQDHFDRLTEIMAANDGAVVKTIGDAVMAVFRRPEDGVRAALEILGKEPDESIVKLGLHLGPCIALNLNDRLDYFGGTVNRAARLQGQARGRDLVISEELFRAPGVRDVLREYRRDIKLSRFTAVLRGLNGGNTLYRIRTATAMQAVS